MCEMMKELNIPWYAMCRADTVSLNVWDKMKRKWLPSVKIGVESGDQYVVDKIVNKHLDLELTKKMVKHCVSIGLSVHGTFTLGHPGETEEQQYKTLKFIKDTPFYLFHQISGASRALANTQ